MAIGADDVRHIASLARLAVPEEQIPELVSQPNGILSHMAALGTVKPKQDATRDGATRDSVPKRTRNGASGCGGSVSVRSRSPASKRLSSLPASSVTS